MDPQPWLNTPGSHQLDLTQYFVPYHHEHFLRSSCRSWLYRKQFLFFKKKEEPQLVIPEGYVKLFTLFSGGTIAAPPARRWEVLGRLVADLEPNNDQAQLLLNQLAYAAPDHEIGCRMAIDVDATNRVLTEAELVHLSRVLHATLDAYFGRGIRVVCLCSAKPRSKDRQLKFPVHLIAHVRVTTDQCRQLLLGFKMRLKQSPFDMRGIELDFQIYKTQDNQVNLRMVFCYGKNQDCPQCKGTAVQSEHSTCAVCQGHPRGVVSRYPYEPHHALNVDGHVDTKMLSSWETIHDTVLACSLWPQDSDDTGQGFAIPDTDPTWEQHLKFEMQLREASQPHAKRSKGQKAGPSLLPTNATNMEVLPLQATVKAQVEQFISNFRWLGSQPWHFFKLKFMKRRVMPMGKICHQIHLFTDADVKCIFANRNHGSGRVYFVVNERTGQVQQRCHSDKEEACRTRSQEIHCFMPSNLTCKLFGKPELPSKAGYVGPVPQSLQATQKTMLLGNVVPPKASNKRHLPAGAGAGAGAPEEVEVRPKKKKYISSGALAVPIQHFSPQDLQRHKKKTQLVDYLKQVYTPFET